MLPGEQAHNYVGNPSEEDSAVSLTMMTKTFILTNVTPQMRKRLSESCCYILGKALLWYIFYPNNTVPQEFGDRIKFELKEVYHASGVNVDDADFNPVTKVPVIISGDEGAVFIEVVDEVSRAEFGRIGGGGGGSAVGAGICEQLLALQSGMSQIHRDIHNIKMNQGVDKSMLLKQLGILNGNVKRIGNQPVRMLAAAALRRREENLNLLAGVVAHAGG